MEVVRDKLVEKFFLECLVVGCLKASGMDESMANLIATQHVQTSGHSVNVKWEVVMRLKKRKDVE